MRLTKLAYRFAAASGTTVYEGEVELSRDVPAGAAVVVELPHPRLERGLHESTVDLISSEPLTLRGKLTAELDQVVRIFKVSAEIRSRSTASAAATASALE